MASGRLSLTIFAFEKLRISLLKSAIFVAVSIMVGVIVSTCGPVGFIGLMCPHMVRLLVGADHRRLMPATVLFGGAFTFSVTLSWPWIAANHLSHDLFAAHTIREDPILEFDETSDEVSPWIGTYLGRYGRAAATAERRRGLASTSPPDSRANRGGRPAAQRVDGE